MKKSLKIVIIILVVILAIILIDTLQAKVLNNSPILKITEKYSDGDVLSKDKGILVYTYSYKDNSKKTVYRWEKYFPVETVGYNNENNTNKTSDSNILNAQIFSKEIDNIKITLNIPYTWTYEELEDNLDKTQYKYTLKLYKSDVDKYATLYIYENVFGVCGTERENTEITLNNGKKATIGYYSNNPNWSDISFFNTNNIAIINNGLVDSEANELLEIIKGINITENAK